MMIKFDRILPELKRGLSRIPMRLSEVVANAFFFARTGRRKIDEQIQYYASEVSVIPDIHPQDFIFQFLTRSINFDTKRQAVQYYFHDGKNSSKQLSRLITDELGLEKRDGLTLLEFASGYGCVTRHLANELAPIKITACDIHVAACDFINNVLGVNSIWSSSTPENLNISSDTFDIVFALSFFTHMPEKTWGRWLCALYDKVKPGGHLIFTTHGRFSNEIMGGVADMEFGFWFSPISEQKDLDAKEYGSTIVSTVYVRKAIERLLQQKIFYLAEGKWWGHQDLYVVHKSI